MDKNQIIKYVLIAGAAYLVYRYLQSAGYLGAAPAAPGEIVPGDSVGAGAAATITPSTIVAAPPAKVDSSSLRAKMEPLLAADASGGMASDGVTRTHDFYVYQYYYQQLMGRDLPPSEAFGLSDDAGRSRLMTFNEFWTLLMSVQSAGKAVGYPGLGNLNLLQIQRLASAWTM